MAPLAQHRSGFCMQMHTHRPSPPCLSADGEFVLPDIPLLFLAYQESKKKKKNANAFSIILTETCEKYICMMQHSGYVLTLCRRIFVYTSGFHTCTCIIITGGAYENTGLWTLFPELLIQYL